MIDPFIAKLERCGRRTPEDRIGLKALSEGRSRHHPARVDIVSEGGPPRRVRFVVSGWAYRYKHLPDGRRQIVALLLPGDVCDHDVSAVAALDHTIGSLTAVTMREVEEDVFEALSCADGYLGRALRRAAAVELAIQREWAFNVGRRDARERLAHLFCELAYRLGAVGLIESGGFDLPMTQVDLADVLGATSVHVNRMLASLRRVGLVALERRRLTIPDLGALEKAALFDPTYLRLGTRPDLDAMQP